MKNKGQVIIYKTKEGGTNLRVRLDRNTVWLSQAMMAKLFNKSIKTINEHTVNIYQEKELEKESTIRKLRIVRNENGRKMKRNITFYNLDVIISVGYRVKSLRGTQFRIWATKVLRNYLVKGYAINRKRLSEQAQRLETLKKAISSISEKALLPVFKGQEQELLKLINGYAGTLTLLGKYDKNRLTAKGKGLPRYSLSYEESLTVVARLKKHIMAKKEGGTLFGQEVEHKFEAVVGAIYQQFDKKDLYQTIEEKAANMFYLTIKDHPFVDGNKRIASILFIYFLKRNSYSPGKTSESELNNSSLVALALLVAVSPNTEKEIMINLIISLISSP